MKSRKTSFAAPTPEARGSPQIPPPQTENTRRKAPSRRKTQKGPATEGQCHFNGHDYPAWLGFDPQKPGGTFKHAFPAVDGDPWEGTMRMMNEHDDDVCDAWNDEIQNLLIFSGLFSAVVTAFAIETQKLLQPDPENATVLLLAQLSSHFLTDTTKTDKLAEPFLNSDPNRQTFRINCLMFSSLIISLGTALVGIIVLQWVRSYRNVEGGYDRDGIPMREARLKAFETWRVPTIIAYLPVSLGVSFIIFLVGLIDFLESLDPTVSAIIGALVSIIVVFLLVTTFLPGLHMLCSSHPFPFCAYQSAQSMLCCRLFTGFKCAKEWTTLISDLYKRSHENVRDEWLKDSLVGIFRRFNSAQAFRLAYLCFQSIPKDVSKNVNLRYDIVSEVIRDSKDLSKIGEEMMQSIASKGMLSSVASSEFFSLLLLLWNSRLGPDYALHRAELNFRCIQTFSHLPNPEYQKLIDLWWRKSAPEPSLADESKQWRSYLTTFLTALQSTPTLDEVQRPLAFSLFWKLVATRVRAKSTPPPAVPQEGGPNIPKDDDYISPAQSLSVVQDCLRVLTTWLLKIQALPDDKYDPMERNRVLRFALQPMFDYNVFTVDIANSNITQRPSSFLNFLDIFLDPNNKRLKDGWDDAIEHAWAEKWDDFLIESNLHVQYCSLAKNKKALRITSEPGSISEGGRPFSPVETPRTISPESNTHFPDFTPTLEAHPDALEEVITHDPGAGNHVTFMSPVSDTSPGAYVSPIPTRPPQVPAPLIQDGGRLMELHPLLGSSDSPNPFDDRGSADASQNRGSTT